jgi:hypothetical protein
MLSNVLSIKTQAIYEVNHCNYTMWTFRMNLQDIEARANPLPKWNWGNQPRTCLCESSIAGEPELSPSCG